MVYAKRYTYTLHCVYIVTTLRLSQGQKRRLEEAQRVLEARRGRSVAKGEVVERLARFALERRGEWAQEPLPEPVPWRDDPLFDPDIGFDMGKTDERTVHRLLYGRR